MNAFANHFAFEFKSTLRNPTLLLMNYLFPLGPCCITTELSFQVWKKACSRTTTPYTSAWIPHQQCQPCLNT